MSDEDVPWHPIPFRTNPYVQDQDDTEQELEETGLSLSVDGPTISFLVEGAADRVANGWQDALGGAVDFVQDSLKKTFDPNKKPLFNLLPNKDEPSSSYGSPTAPAYAPTPSIGTSLLIMSFNSGWRLHYP